MQCLTKLDWLRKQNPINQFQASKSSIKDLLNDFSDKSKDVSIK